jgi:hypothetical protein
MSAGALEASGSGVPEFLSWDELQRLPEELASEIELWARRVVWNRRGPLEHQRFAVRMRNALESNARRAAWEGSDETGEPPCWQVEVETNVFFTADKSSSLTPDFFVRRCLPRGADTTASDVAVVGEVLSGSDTPKWRAWKMDRYAEAGIPWYWEVELDSDASWDISAIRAYELAQVAAAGLAVKPLRPAVTSRFNPSSCQLPEPFGLRIAWDDLAF